jgi:hypothetical protein
MDSENALLEKTTFRSEFNHYKKTGSGIEYDNTEPQPDDRVDTMFTQIPDIPHGSLSAEALGPLKRLKRMIKTKGTMVFTSMSESEHQSFQVNMKEAQDNMLRYKLSAARLWEINDFIRSSEVIGCAFLRSQVTLWARTIAVELEVPDAENLEVDSVRYVKARAGQYHQDRPGLGPNPMVVVTKSNSAYKVMMARIKPGCRAEGVLHRQTHNVLSEDDGDDEYCVLMMKTETGLRAPPDTLHQNNEILHA